MTTKAIDLNTLKAKSIYSPEEVNALYLDYVCNFLTVTHFAGHYGLTVEVAKGLIDMGRNFHESMSVDDALLIDAINAPVKPAKLLIEVSQGLDTPVKIEQITKRQYTVTYGLDIKTGLSYKVAMDVFSSCVAHSMECTGEISYVYQ